MSSPGSATVKDGTWQWWQSPWQPLLFWLSLVSPGLEEYTGSDLTVNCRIVGLPSSIQCCPHTCDHPDVCLLHLHDSLTKRHRRQWVLEGKAIGIPDIVYMILYSSCRSALRRWSSGWFIDCSPSQFKSWTEYLILLYLPEVPEVACHEVREDNGLSFTFVLVDATYKKKMSLHSVLKWKI